MTYDGSGVGFVELLLQTSDTESNVEEIYCIAAPSNPSTATINFCKVYDRTRLYPVKNCAH
jgi:hypothetical protein